MEIVFARFSQSRTGESEESKGAKMATEEEEDELYASVRTTALDPPRSIELRYTDLWPLFFLFFSFTARRFPNKRSRRFPRKRLAKTRRALSQPRRRMIRVPWRVTPRPPCP